MILVCRGERGARHVCRRRGLTENSSQIPLDRGGTGAVGSAGSERGDPLGRSGWPGVRREWITALASTGAWAESSREHVDKLAQRTRTNPGDGYRISGRVPKTERAALVDLVRPFGGRGLRAIVRTAKQASLCESNNIAWPSARRTALRGWGLSGSRDIGGEFDPGSGSTLAACLMHASRTGSLSGGSRGGRVRSTWASCPGAGDSRRKRRAIPRTLVCRWGGSRKDLRVHPGRRLRPISWLGG
jgi:hypothetical protein